MRVIAFYTRGTGYEQEASLLAASLDRVGMSYTITDVEDLGGWYAATRYKAFFVRDQRESLRGPLLYLDVDAFVHGNCEAYFDGLAEAGYDFGAHWFRGPAKGHNRSKVRDEGWWMLSGTLFLGDTSACKNLLQTWCDLNTLLSERGVEEGGGQKNLWYLTTCMLDLKIARLPGRYTYVFDKPWAYDPKEPKIIEHTIGSRDHRPMPGQPDSVEARYTERNERIDELRRRVA